MQTPYVWFDLVCIPQDRSALAQREIARQATDFKNATNVTGLARGPVSESQRYFTVDLHQWFKCYLPSFKGCAVEQLNAVGHHSRGILLKELAHHPNVFLQVGNYITFGFGRAPVEVVKLRSGTLIGLSSESVLMYMAFGDYQ